jgi:hypothetical protein
MSQEIVLQMLLEDLRGLQMVQINSLSLLGSGQRRGSTCSLTISSATFLEASF